MDVDPTALEAHRLGDGWVVFLVRPSATATQRDPADLLTGWGAHLDGVQHLYVVPGGHPQAASLEARFPARFNTIIIGLTVMMWVWIWLYGVWHQQLDDGVAWTTAGHMRSRLPRIIVALAEQIGP